MFQRGRNPETHRTPVLGTGDGACEVLRMPKHTACTPDPGSKNRGYVASVLSTGGGRVCRLKFWTIKIMSKITIKALSISISQ
ncbi:Unannotated [Lentimonas sp. CC19]|nr:Unannotated [Lentimonas sp. CC10]CAA6690959.1 Unannotated [Lentimonas sp. CC19]CAA7069393.1 Unannotated [Lentimonas sp. CC11]